jgi:hypothetical protein
MLLRSMWTTKFTANISNSEIYLRVKLLPRNEYTTSLFFKANQFKVVQRCSGLRSIQITEQDCMSIMQTFGTLSLVTQ